MKVVRVDLGERSYPVYIGGDVARLGEVAGQFDLGEKVLIISSRAVASLCGKKVKDALESAAFQVSLARVPDGEKYKTLSQAAKLYEECTEKKLDRNSTILALGGGVIGDLAGFVASTYARGINFTYVPTTLLAQVDASIGGKVGVDLPQGKNLVGSFYQPRFVYMDLRLLTTLPRIQIREGLAEIIKYGIIEDQDLFLHLEQNLEEIQTLSLDSLRYVITRCVQIKAAVVQEDEREKRGKRQVLNFGHTIGHAVESATGYGRYSHGQAVAVGMIGAAKIANKMGFFRKALLTRLENLVMRADLPTRVEGVNEGKLWDALHLDKKIREKQLCFVLPRRIGEVFLTDKVPLALVREAIKELGVEK